MKRTTYSLAFLVWACLLLAAFTQLSAQDNDQQLTATILHRDSLFWKAFNTCDVAGMGAFFTSDMEFYHDKGGLTKGLKDFLATTQHNLCSTDTFHLRREEVAGSVSVFPLRKGGLLYGAILSGEHQFYILQKGRKEVLDGQARFTHLWLLDDGAWKMSRILSYDHGPAGHINHQTAIALSPILLATYTGTYKGDQTGIITVTADSGRLILQAGNNKFIIYPQGENKFFSKGRDLVFEFTGTGGKVPDTMIVHEHGEIVEKLSRVQ